MRRFPRSASKRFICSQETSALTTINIRAIKAGPAAGMDQHAAAQLGALERLRTGDQSNISIRLVAYHRSGQDAIEDEFWGT